MPRREQRARDVECGDEPVVRLSFMAIDVYTTLMSSAATIPRTVTCSRHGGSAAAGSDSMSDEAASRDVLSISPDAPRSWRSMPAPAKASRASSSSSSPATGAEATTPRGLKRH